MSTITCPKCGSIQVRSNKLDAPVDKIAHGAHALHRLGVPFAPLGLLAAIGLKAVDNLRNDWACNSCDHRFS